MGIYDNLLFSSTIDRNKSRIPGEVLQAVIEGTQEFFDELKAYGVNIHLWVVKRLMWATWSHHCRKRNDDGPLAKVGIITNEKIAAGDVIIGISSSGKSVMKKNIIAASAATDLPVPGMMCWNPLTDIIIRKRLNRCWTRM